MASVRAKKPAINPNVANILKTYHRATADEIQEGLNWYAQASAEACRRLAEYPAETALGAVAALSPQVAWARNIWLTEQLVETGNCPHWMKANIDKARRILAGEAPADVLGGNKVRAFFACLIDQGAEDVCVDGHAYAIWMGVRTFTSKVPSIGDRLYRTIAEDYREAAAVAGIKPHQMQAITWVAWRRLHAARNFKDPGKNPADNG